MTTRLRRIIRRLEALPEEDQDTYAAFIEAELEGDATWDRLFAETSEEEWRAFSEGVERHREEGTLTLDDLRHSG